MTRPTTFFFTLFLFSAFVVKAQFEKANDLYSAKQYTAAIPYFEKGLLEKDNLSAKARLANCYRLTNKMEQAEAIYAVVVEQPKAKPDAFLHYAETLMSNGKYDRARQFFEQYFKLEPLDSTGFWMARNCSLVASIKPYFPWVSVEKMPFNSDSDDNSAVFLARWRCFHLRQAGWLCAFKAKSRLDGSRLPQTLVGKMCLGHQFWRSERF